jgi:hypothetical protein
VYAAGSLTLLERAAVAVASGGMPARPFAGETQLFQIAPAPPPGFRRPKLLVDDALELLDAGVVSAPSAADPRIRVGLAWRLRAPAPGQYAVTVEIVDREGSVLAFSEHPLCYNIYPPARWTPGAVVREDTWLPLDTPPRAGPYGVAVSIAAHRGARRVSVERLSEDVVPVGGRAIVSLWTAR